MSLKTICIFICLLMLPWLLAAQQTAGEILQDGGKPLAGVSVLVLRSADSSQVTASVSDRQGRFSVKTPAAGSYILSASFIGHAPFYKNFVVKQQGENVRLPPITLHPEAVSLGKVEVTGRKPFIEQRIDRMIVNVAGSIISSGSTALEILQKTPGITVDQQNDMLSLRGKQGVIVQIDGKQTYLPAEQVVAMLRNMPGGNIDRIEVITNPSAKYDAAGNAGIIDIRLKKNNNKGTNGSISLSGGSGRKDRERGSFQLNHKTGKFNFFTNYAFNRGGDYWDFRFDRILQDGAGKNYVHQSAPLSIRNTGHNAKAGVDFQVSPQTTLGLLWTGAWTERTENSMAQTAFRQQPDAAVYLETLTAKKIANSISNQLASLSLQHTFNNKAQLSANFDAGRFARDFLNSLTTRTLAPTDSSADVAGLLSVMRTNINILTFGADYSRPLKSGWNLQAGWKSSVVKSANDMKLSQGENGNLLYDSALSNNFVYKENINAVYINASGKLDSMTEFQAGLRLEQTLSNANSITQQKQVKRNYLNLFPSVFINRKLNAHQTLAFSYSYRINRPNYQNLNPVRSYLDPYAYFKGNAFLRPDFTHSFEIKHGYNDKVFVSLGASYTRDLISLMLTPVDPKTTERSPANIGKAASYDLIVTAPLNVMKDWTLQWTATGTYAKYRFVYIDSFFRSTQVSGKLDLTNAFTFGKGWSAELTGWVTTPAVESVWRYPWLASADAGVQKVIRSLKIKFSVSDLFHSDMVRARINTPQFSNDVRIRFDTRVALLNVVYNFGNQQMRSRQRKSGSEEELKRMSSN